MDNPDRDAILARRALFISTALAGIACTTREPPKQPDAEPVQHAVAAEDVERNSVKPSGR